MNFKSPDAPEWFRSVVEQYEGQLLRYAARITGDVERARDVVQETFARLFSQELAEVEHHVAEWLFRVCRNRALDIRKKESRMRSLDDVELQSHRTESPSEATERGEQYSVVMELLSKLPGNQQEVLRLKFQNGLSYREISKVTGESVSNVGYLIHKGLRVIRKKLETSASSEH